MVQSWSGRREINLRIILPVMLFGSSLMADGWAQSKGTAKRASSAISMKSVTEGTISVSFVSAPDGAALTGGTSGHRGLNLGSVHTAGAQTANVNVTNMPGQ